MKTTEQCIPVVFFDRLYKVVLYNVSTGNFLSLTASYMYIVSISPGIGGRGGIPYESDGDARRLA